jgi:serine phosphatase RsbU (regulator of sigma subunit)/anti-sigma regulatory factor (Ser/Thr protein kinase)
MSPDLDAFRSGYLAAFRSYLRGGGETGLETAYELGREAVAGELSLLELAGIHHEVLADCLASAPNGELERIARAGTDFFRESLSTFEMIQRGFGEAQQTARLEQRHAAQLRGLAEAALSLSSALSEEEMLELLGERACAIVGADRSAVSMVADGGDGPRTPIRERGRLVAPLIDRDERALGLLELTGKRGGEFTEDDESIVMQLAHMASVAIENARLYERERGIALELQSTLLPDGLPEIAGVDTEVRYRAGGDGDVGGDWYEVIPLPGGRVGMAIGDVVGRGVRAAAMMGQLRMALRAYALEGEWPGFVAERMARFVRTLDRDEMSTCVYAVLEPATGELRSANAGHLPPLVLAADGSATFLTGRPGLPLGVAADYEYPERRATLEPGSTVLLYTDGLVEKRGEPLDVGLERLRQVAASRPVESLEELCERVLDALVRESPGDDVALLAVRVLPLHRGPLHLELRAEPGALAELRRRLGAWLAQAGAGEQEAYDMVLASCEAAANAIGHAYGPADATFRVTARAEEGEVTIEVRDFGAWRPEQRDPLRGRGLVVMGELMEEVSVTSDDEGTNVRLRRRLRGGRQRERAGSDRD